VTRIPHLSGALPASDEAMKRPSDVAPERRMRWSAALVWFMRIVALLWIAKGLSFWAVILGAGYGPALFETRTLGFQATVVYFAVIDLVAAVGLWLTSTWGGVMWLLAVMSHLILFFFFPGIVGGNWVLGAINGGLVLVYLILSWLAAGED
jgi:hypothetical protein